MGCRLWGCTGSDTTEATEQEQQGLSTEMDPRVSSFSNRTYHVSDISQGLADERTICLGELISPSSCSLVLSFFLAMLNGLQDLSSQTSDQTPAA